MIVPKFILNSNNSVTIDNTDGDLVLNVTPLNLLDSGSYIQPNSKVTINIDLSKLWSISIYVSLPSPSGGTNYSGKILLLLFTGYGTTTKRQCLRLLDIAGYKAKTFGFSNYNYNQEYPIDVNNTFYSLYVNNVISTNGYIAGKRLNADDIIKYFRDTGAIPTGIPIEMNSNGVDGGYSIGQEPVVIYNSTGTTTFIADRETSMNAIPPELYFKESQNEQTLIHIPMNNPTGKVITGVSQSETIKTSALLEIGKAVVPEITINYKNTQIPVVTDT